MPDRLSDRLRAHTDPNFNEDWIRQRRTAEDVLERLQTQEGVILADQVGMGKTYVALAVAVSEILAGRTRGQVVIFVPSAVADKWVREWRKFEESLLDSDLGIRCVDQPIRSAEAFLKALDDAPTQRKHIVVVTHTAMTATLKDSFVQLALLHYATRRIHGGSALRQRIAKWCTGRSGLISHPEFGPARVGKLLEVSPLAWREAWRKFGGSELVDDPVPEALDAAADKLSLQSLRDAIQSLPVNSSGNIESRLAAARKALAQATQSTWKYLLSAIELDLPLLIVDEAHRLKNPDTLISGLFAKRSDDSAAGTLDGIFRRMLFLTATPFELGHSELVEVLSRMDAVQALRPRPPVPLVDRLKDLKSVLTTAQATALTFDAAWGRLSPDDLPTFDNWSAVTPAPEHLGALARDAWEQARLTCSARKEMHAALKPWVIRHERARRRVYHPGAAIASQSESVGLDIPDYAALPFLLAARAQSMKIATARNTSRGASPARPLFAYGIASSYEAFLRLGSDQFDAARDSDAPEEDGEARAAAEAAGCPDGDAVGWYREEIVRALGDNAVRDRHPKVQATVDKAVQLWCSGEKCLVFCWFIKTGEAVAAALERRVNDLILARASAALGTAPDAATWKELDGICSNLFRRDSTSDQWLRRQIAAALAEPAGHLEDVVEFVVETVLGHLRVSGSGYLVRFTHLARYMDHEAVWAGIHGDNPAGVNVMRRWQVFAERLANARRQLVTGDPDQHPDSDFSRIRAALLGAAAEEGQGAGRAGKRAPVRRAHGGTERHDRERLIAQFNTPLSPDILVASSVMGEGIDLHQECRFVIHHDLDWNPSVLEQRTGRLDRIGAFAEREGKPIEVFEPYLAGTHDEKMFRVVKDRAQWFDIVMGRATSADEGGTDAEEARVQLHVNIRKAMSLDLRSP
jgi:hypothetical protein